MRNHAAAAASTFMALVSSGECFIATPAAAGIGDGRTSSCSSAGDAACSSTTTIARAPPGYDSESFSAYSRAGGVRRRRDGSGPLRAQSEDVGAPARAASVATSAAAVAATAQKNRAHPTVKRPPRGQGRQSSGKMSASEAGVERKRQGRVQELNKQLQRFASLRMWRQALAALDKAKADGLPITSSVYSCAINAMSKGGRYKEAMALLEEMIAGGSAAPGRGDPAPTPRGPNVSPSVTSYNAAIMACARANKAPAALRLLDEMSSRSGLAPDAYSYAAALSALARARNPAAALRLLGEMRAAGVEPDAVCLKAAMEACESKGASEEAAEVLEQVRELDPQPSPSALTGILTSAIGACAAEGAWERAVDWLTDVRMVNGGRLPPAPAYAAAAYACARAGQGVRARSLISELERGGGGGAGESEEQHQRPTLECYNAVVLGYAMSGDMDGALRTLKEEVVDAGLKPDTQGFNHAIQGYARLGDWQKALALLYEQRSGDFPDARPNRASYNAAMEACGRAGQVRAALALLDAMRAASLRNPRLRPDRASYAGALQACRAAGDGSAALALLRSMRKDGVKRDQRCSLAAFSAVIAGPEGSGAGGKGREDDAADILEDMIRERVSTSGGALAAARESLAESIKARGGGGVKFARAMAALGVLEEAQAKKAAAKAERAAAEAGEMETGEAGVAKAAGMAMAEAGAAAGGKGVEGEAESAAASS